MEEEITRNMTRQEYMKQFMQKYNSVKVKCDVCNRDISKGSKYRHYNSKMHKAILDSVKKLEPITELGNYHGLNVEL